MKKPGMQQIWLAISCLLCVFLALQNTHGLDGTEFSGGWLTGPLLSMAEIGTCLFLLAIIMAFLFSRVAAAIGLASSLLCLLLYVFFTAPVLFNHIFGFGHEFKVLQSGGFHWQNWPMAGVLASSFTIYICFRTFVATGRKQIP